MSVFVCCFMPTESFPSLFLNLSFYLSNKLTKLILLLLFLFSLFFVFLFAYASLYHLELSSSLMIVCSSIIIKYKLTKSKFVAKQLKMFTNFKFNTVALSLSHTISECWKSSLIITKIVILYLSFPLNKNIHRQTRLTLRVNFLLVDHCNSTTCITRK